jgi:hypothetical protein
MTQATYLRTADVPIDDLTPYPGNAKKGDTRAILDSLRRNAQYRAVVARELPDGSLIVLAGNNTLAAMREHGPGDCGTTFTRRRRKLPCGVCSNRAGYIPFLRAEVVSCDDDTARRANLADNKTAELGTWDTEALAELLAGLDDDLDGTAYSGEDYDELLKVTGALAESTTAFLSDLTGPAPAPTAPALHPFSDTAPPVPGQQVASPTAASADLEEPAAAGEDRPAPPPMSPGVHTGPEAYSGPGARSSAGVGIELPPPVTTVPLQWVFTVPQRDTVRAAIKQAQAAGGYDTAAEALTAICAAYLPVSVDA